MALTFDLIYASLKDENAALREAYTEQQALILQLVEALERVRFDSLNMTIKDMQACGVAVGAARAHLGTNPPPGPNAPKPTA